MKTVIITGITGDIGFAIFKKFNANGYFVIGQYNSNKQKADLLLKNFSNIDLYQCDFNNLSAVEELSSVILNKYKSIDCIVNNAGVDSQEMFQDENIELIKRITNINLLAPMVLTRELMKNMIPNKKGSIVNISSIWGKYGGSCEVAYSASKGGLISFTKALSKELGLSNIRVNCITCGYIDTKMNAKFTEEDKQGFCESVSLNRIGTPDEVANTVYYLSSDDASYITGQIIGVDGGFN